jgi:hypothetical protein
MAIAGQERISYKGVKKDPFSPENIGKTQARIDRFVSLGRVINSELRPDQGEATVCIPGKMKAVRILIVSDLHLFNDASDPKAAKQIREEINKPNTYVIFAGDLIEGIKEEHKETNGLTFLTFQQQIDTFRETWLRPMVKDGKVLAMVTRYNGHEGWPSDDGSLDAWASMTQGVTMNDGSRIPMIWNEGTLNVRFVEDRSEISLACYHQVAGAGTTNNPVRPLRGVFVNQKIPRGETKPRGGFAGHNHGRAGVSSERTMAGNVEVQLVLLQNGTIKGLEQDHPDVFLKKRGVGTVQPSGAAMVIRNRPDDSGGLQVIPTYGYDRSQKLLRAMEVYNLTESNRTTDELIGSFEQTDGGIRLELAKGQSLMARRSGTKFNSPLYRQLVWNVRGGSLGLPVRVVNMAHIQRGTSMVEQEKVNEVIEDVAGSRYSLLLVLNDTLGRNVPRQFGRRTVLQEFANEMGRVPLERRAGFMLDSIWRDDGWNKQIKNPNDKYDVDEPLVTGDELYLRSGLKGTQLFEGGGTVVFKLGGADYFWYCIDGVGNYGSRQDPYLALIQMDKATMVLNDVTTGGNSVIPGALTMPDRIYLANGWFCPVVEKRFGKDSAIRAPFGGQGAVMLPNHGGKMIFGGGSDRELRETFRALTVLVGAEKTGQLEKITVRKGRR